MLTVAAFGGSFCMGFIVYVLYSYGKKKKLVSQLSFLLRSRFLQDRLLNLLDLFNRYFSAQIQLSKPTWIYISRHDL